MLAGTKAAPKIQILVDGETVTLNSRTAAKVMRIAATRPDMSVDQVASALLDFSSDAFKHLQSGGRIRVQEPDESLTVNLRNLSLPARSTWVKRLGDRSGAIVRGDSVTFYDEGREYMLNPVRRVSIPVGTWLRNTLHKISRLDFSEWPKNKIDWSRWSLS